MKNTSASFFPNKRQQNPSGDNVFVYTDATFVLIHKLWLCMHAWGQDCFYSEPVWWLQMVLAGREVGRPGRVIEREREPAVIQMCREPGIKRVTLGRVLTQPALVVPPSVELSVLFLTSGVHWSSGSHTVLELMVKLDFLIYGPCHAPFISMATEGQGEGKRRGTLGEAEVV
ncbi:hypothetical protein JOQ06_009233, partial [Pogonophryne albipinna]